MAGARDECVPGATARSAWISPWLDRIGLAVLCLVHFLVVCDASSRSTPTIDEFAHLPAGLSYLQRRSFGLYPHNPPLPRLLSALAAETRSPRMVYDGTWASATPNHLLFAEEFLLANTRTADGARTYFAAFRWGRSVIAAWSALTIPILFLWGRWWFGRGAGWTAAWLWAWCPAVIAHAGLVTTDVAAASTSVLAAWTIARWVQNRARPVVAGATLGLALLTKFSVVLLIPITIVWAMGVLRTRRVARQLAAVLFVALLVLNAGYLFEGTGRALGEFDFFSQLLSRPRRPGDPPLHPSPGAYLAPDRINRFAGSRLGMLPCPVPAPYLVGLDMLTWEAESKYDVYLRGTWRRQRGFRAYYLYALLVKWPLSTWAVAGLAGVGAIAARRRRSAAREAASVARLTPWLVLAAAPVATLSLLQNVDLGLRYVLPAFPFLFLLAGTAAGDDRPRWCRRAVIVALAFNVVSVARVHPHELAFFNELVGGPSRGRFHVIDSNLDWGQDLARLADWIREHPEWSDVRLGYWGAVPPEVVGIERHRLAPRDLRYVPSRLMLPDESRDDLRTWGPQPGKYAISVNFERGMAFRTPCPRDLLGRLSPDFPGRFGYEMLIVPRDVYRYFEELTPRIEPRVGYSLLLYDVTLAETNRVRRRIGLPELADQGGAASGALIPLPRHLSAAASAARGASACPRGSRSRGP